MSAESIFVLGVNHKTAPVEVREQLAFTDDPEAPFRHFKGITGCEEFCFLSTCNRVEVIFTSPRKEETIREIRRFLFKQAASAMKNLRNIPTSTMDLTLLHIFTGFPPAWIP